MLNPAGFKQALPTKLMLNPSGFKRALQKIDSLGSTPGVLVKVIKLANDINTDMSSINALLRNDGPLVADIIRISNSPYYAPVTPHSNLNSALNMLGMSEVIRMVNLSLARQLFARDLTSYGVSAFDYWSSSVASALVMAAVAKKIRLNSEDAYTLGILHAIGRVLINRVIEEKGFSIFWDAEEPIEKWECDSVGVDFAEAGSMLLNHWHFPNSMCEIISKQLRPEPLGDHPSMLGALQFTRRLLDLTGWDFEKKDWQLPSDDPFMSVAGLTPDWVSEMVSICREDFQKLLMTVDLK